MFFWCSPVKKPCRKLVQRIEKKHYTCIHQTPSQTSLKDRETFSVLRVEKALNSQVYIRFHDFFHVYGVGVWKGSSQIGRLFVWFSQTVPNQEDEWCSHLNPSSGEYTLGPFRPAMLVQFFWCLWHAYLHYCTGLLNTQWTHQCFMQLQYCVGSVGHKLLLPGNILPVTLPQNFQSSFYNFFVNCSWSSIQSRLVLRRMCLGREAHRAMSLFEGMHGWGFKKCEPPLRFWMLKR